MRLIDEEGNQLGIIAIRDALRMAEDRGLDLVEVAANAQPPVCRLMDFGKYKYEQAKRDREARRHQHVIDIKEVKMRPNIDVHDFDVKARSAERFLREGNKVKCTIMFRGREIVHSSRGGEVLQQLQDRLQELATVESLPKVEGRTMVMVLAPKAGIAVDHRDETAEGQGSAHGEQA